MSFLKELFRRRRLLPPIEIHRLSERHQPVSSWEDRRDWEVVANSDEIAVHQRGTFPCSIRVGGDTLPGNLVVAGDSRKTTLTFSSQHPEGALPPRSLSVSNNRDVEQDMLWSWTLSPRATAENPEIIIERAPIEPNTTPVVKVSEYARVAFGFASAIEAITRGQLKVSPAS